MHIMPSLYRLQPLLSARIIMLKPYRERYSFEQRVAKVRSFQESDPDKLMVIVEKHPKSKLPDLQNSKFLTFRSFKYAQVKALVERRIKERIAKEKEGKEGEGKESYYLFVNGAIPHMEQTMQAIYDRHRDKDGILYITYQEQQSF